MSKAEISPSTARISEISWRLCSFPEILIILPPLRQKGKRTFSLKKLIFPSIQLKQHRFLHLICSNDKLEISCKLSAFMACQTSKDGKNSQYLQYKAFRSFCSTLNSHLLTIYTDLGFKIVLLPLFTCVSNPTRDFRRVVSNKALKFQLNTLKFHHCTVIINEDT